MAATMNLSDRDLSLLKSAFLSFKSTPQIDFGHLAELENYKTAASASTAWFKLRKKLGLSGTTTAADSPTKKRKGDSTEQTSDVEMPTPVKKKGGARKIKNEVVESDPEVDGNDADVDGSEVSTELADAKAEDDEGEIIKVTGKKIKPEGGA